MTCTDGATSAEDRAEALLAAYLERYHEVGGDPEAELFAVHPEHAATLRRWWQQLVATGAVGRASPAGERFGPFVLIRALGQGAQGTVHLAEDTRLGRTVALKLLPRQRLVREQARSRFRREAELASRLQHPSICTVFETGEHQGTAFIAMQYVEGSTLEERLATARTTGEPLSLDFVLRFVERTARALQAAHDAGLVHRDIKPGNLMVAADDAPVVLDFGLARDDGEANDLTQTGDLLGTPAYMSPEQLHGGRFPVDARTDVYALGVTLFECLTLRRPFEAPTQQALMQQILTTTAPDPRRWRPELPRDLTVVLATALAKNRDHRYASAAAFAEDLRRLLTNEPLLARAIGPLHRLWRWSRCHPGLAASLALAAVSLLGGTAVSSWLYLEAKSAHSDWLSLSDLERLADVERQAERLPPAAPEHRAAFEAWLEQLARPLVERLPRHRSELQALRREAVATAGTEPDPEPPEAARRSAEMRERREELQRNLEAETRAGISQAKAMLQARLARIDRQIAAAEAPLARPRFVFDDPDLAFRHRHLALLVERLEQFVGADGTFPAIAARLAWSRDMERVTVHERVEAWQRAAAEVHVDPRHGERRLVPQLGFVPLGPDPVTSCQEFAFAGGGAVPERDATGQLVLSAASAPVFVLIPTGAPRANAPLPGIETAADPARAVDVDWFLIGKHELTRAQWRRLGGGDPSLFSDEVLGADADLHPVTEVSWSEAKTILARHGLALPSEAQWEFAARGGSTTPFWTGSDAASMQGAANFRDDGKDGFLLTAPVHSLRANGFGLHHVAGNVAEWCHDPQQRSGSRGDAFANVARSRPVRGGAFTAGPAQGRTGTRATRNGDLHHLHIGVRAARAVTER
ncbi:MAG: SUMF1/EgtB/PvdO family nonheme iron enzyme [Planctomycetes bacterium]|nr:SUMF1/EgtB/PvdO family nonheme iron enzyme [Planctomycetota bacterium]